MITAAENVYLSECTRDLRLSNCKMWFFTFIVCLKCFPVLCLPNFILILTDDQDTLLGSMVGIVTTNNYL